MTLTHTTSEAEALGDALEAGRQSIGGPSFPQIERHIFPDLGNLTPSAETLRRYHQGKVEPKNANVIVVIALANLYGMSVQDVCPLIAKELKSVQELLTRSRWVSETCTSDYVPLRFVFDESALGITEPPALYERFVTVADGWHS